MKAPSPSKASQQGVVLIIALVMLVVVSLLSVMSIRNATSTEAVAGNVRTVELAKQSAEIALRFCEDTLVAQHVPTPPPAPSGWNELSYTAGTPSYVDLANNWDKANSPSRVFVLGLSSVNQTATGTFRRPPECMVENVAVVRPGSPAASLDTTSTFIVTARGFGPEVPAADIARTRPIGSEVWLQTTIELN